MASHLKIDELLTAAEKAELEQFARERKRTIDECHEWLQARGYTMSRGAVGNWKAKFEEQLLTEKTIAASGLTKAFMTSVKESGGVEVQDAAVLQLGQKIFEMMVNAGDDMGVDELNKLSLAMQRLTLAKVRTEDVRAEIKREQKAALAEAATAAKNGASGEEVVQKLNQLLGVTP